MTRGGVDLLVGLAPGLRALGAEVRVSAPPDEEFAARLAGVGVPLVPASRSVRAMATGATPRPAAGLPRRTGELMPRSSTRSLRRPRDVTRWQRPA